MKGLTHETETLLEEYFGRKRAFLVGRGATGLMLLYEALASRSGRIILPSIACPSLLATVLAVGKKPVIVDVDENLGLDPAQVSKVVSKGDVVVAVHLFGIPCAVKELEMISTKKGASLIEDVAQSVGGHADGKRMGTYGTASLLSFAKGKILPTDGGGAILTDDEKLITKLETAVDKLPARAKDFPKRFKAMRDQLTPVLNAARRDNPGAAAEWRHIYNAFGNVYRYAIDPLEIAEIPEAFEKLKKNVIERRKKVEWYIIRFNKIGVETLKYPEDCCPFRFSFIVPILNGDSVQELTGEMRAIGLNVSNLYFPLQRLSPLEVETPGCPRAEFVGTRIINLWVDDTIEKSHVQTAAEVISKVIG